MSALIFSAIASLDGYVADREGDFSWAAPGEELHAFVNDLEQPIGTYLYGRRMYDVMRYWDSAGNDLPHVERDYARLWQNADKVVFSRTLESAATGRTRIVRRFEPDTVRELKATAERDLSIGGPSLAAQAFAVGLVDECHLFLLPVLVGGGTRCLPDGVRTALRLLDERRFRTGAVHLHYRVEPDRGTR